MRRISTSVLFFKSTEIYPLCYFQTRWKISSPADELQRKVGQLVSKGDIDQVIHEIRTSLNKSIFSMKAFANALFLCEKTHKEIIGIELIRQVQDSKLVETWNDESVLAVVLRLQCAAGDFSAAKQMFSFMISNKLLRLRSVSVFLAFCCQRLDRPMAFAVYEEALRHKIELCPKDYIQLGRLCVAVREPISTLHFILREMQEHVTGLPRVMIYDVLRPWAAGLRVTEVQLQNNNNNNYSCPCCGEVLKGHRFTSEMKTRLLKDVLEAARVAPRGNNVRVRNAFEAWRRFITTHGERIDILIDGANLGYYGLSSWYAEAKRELLLKRGRKETEITPQDVMWSKKHHVDVSVNFQLIDLAVQEAKKRGMRPLVILHERHCEAKNMTKTNEILAAQWRRDGILYCTPSGLNDDLCWLYAALELTTPTDISSTTSLNNKEKIVWVLTNDLMRDHHFKLLSPRFFSRWRDRHRIAFKCSREDGRTLLHWEMPAPYARCIQELKPLVWHIPIIEEKEEEEEEQEEEEKEKKFDNIETSKGDNNKEQDNTGAITPQISSSWICFG